MIIHASLCLLASIINGKHVIEEMGTEIPTTGKTHSQKQQSIATI